MLSSILEFVHGFGDRIIIDYVSSELHWNSKIKRVRNVFAKPNSGYMRETSGHTNLTDRSLSKLTIENILACIPMAVVLEEYFKTSKDIYVII